MFRQEEMFNILKTEWNPNSIPSERFKNAMKELIQKIDEEKLNSPREIILNSYDSFEHGVMELLHQKRDELHSAMNE